VALPIVPAAAGSYSLSGGHPGRRSVHKFLLLLSPGRLLLALSVLIVGYLLYSAGGNVIHSRQLAQNEGELRAQVQSLQIEQKQLEQIRDYLRTDEYIEFMARRVFGLVQPGESLAVVK